MADEFIYFLVGGLAILAVLFVVFGFAGAGFGIGYAGYGNGIRPLSGFANYFVTSPIFIGKATFDTVETMYVRFDANNYLQTNVYNLSSRRIDNGLLFGNSPIKLDLGKSEYTTVSFDVVRTNWYGDIIIKMDGKVVVKQRLDEGHYEFAVGSGRILEIQAENSEWRVWAPDVYELENILVTSSVYPLNTTTFTFNLQRPEEIKSVRMDLYMDGNAGGFIVKLNGDIVYDGAINNEQTLYLDASKLDTVNIITFEARQASKFSGRATLALTRASVQEKVLAVDINMTAAEYANFQGGTVSFDVINIMRPGGYRVTIVNNGQVLMNEYVKLEPGFFVLNVKRENLGPGLNIFVVKSVDDAAFTIQGFSTKL